MASGSSANVSRRGVLRAGVLGAVGLTLPELLQSERPAVGGERTVSASRKGQAKSCIFIHQYGGLSQLDSWDPKPNAPKEVRGPYLPIATATPGFQVGELMPRLARLSESYCVIRSMSHHVPVHDVANKMLLGGSDAPASDAPAFGSVVTKLKPSTENIPSYVWLQKFGGGAAPPEATYLTGGFLGMGHAPLVIGHGHEDNPATEGFRVQAFDTASDVSLQRLQSRWQLRQQLEPVLHQGSLDRPATFEQFQHRAYDLLHGERARVAFDVTQEPQSMRDRYGRNPMGQNLLLARRLVEAGVRLVSVVAWTGLAPGDKFMSLETWDMHGNAGIGIFDNGWNGLGWALPRADQSVAALLEDLKDRGLLESTLVVLVGEFGRTPRISNGAKAIGRDHWPNCYSAMVAGAGIRGGNIIGRSDEQAAYVQDRPVSLADFTSTLYHALDIPPATRLSPDNFTRPASEGTPMRDLF
ncbi:MAG: DUF1501 domain-containing protein [Planctomycetaceae bacterium]